jgi:hypothetical protein
VHTFFSPLDAVKHIQAIFRQNRDTPTVDIVIFKSSFISVSNMVCAEEESSWNILTVALICAVK